MPGTICGVRVALWGAAEGQHQKLKHNFEQELFGGNTGHAALSITMPVNEQTTAWIKQYCGNPEIPVERISVKHYESKRDAQGNWQQTDKVAFEEEVYTVTGSWWPGMGGFYMGTSINQDGYDEREGRHVQWDATNLDFYDVERRVHRGKMGKTDMAYAPLHVMHERGLTESVRERRYMNLMAQEKATQASLESIQVAGKKIFNKVETRRELDEQTKRLTKLKGVNEESQDNLQAITQAIKLVKRGKALEPELLTQIAYALPDKVSQESSMLIVLQDEQEALIKKIVSTQAEIQEATTEITEIKQELRLSQNEIYLLDRFAGNWREDVNYSQDKTLSPDDLKQIRVKLNEAEHSREESLKSIRQEISTLGDMIYTDEQIQVIDNLHDVLDQACYHDAYKECVELSKYFNSVMNYYVSDDYVYVPDLGNSLEQFTALTNWSWPTHQDEHYISQQELAYLKGQLDSYILKQKILRQLYTFLDPGSDCYIEGSDEPLDLDDQHVQNALIPMCELMGIDYTALYQQGMVIDRKKVLELIGQCHDFTCPIENNPRFKALNDTTQLEFKKIEKNVLHDLQLKETFESLSDRSSDLSDGLKLINYILREMQDTGRLRNDVWDKVSQHFDKVVGDALDIALGDDWYEDMFGDDVKDLDELSKQEFLAMFSTEKLKELKEIIELELELVYPLCVDYMPAKDSIQANDFEAYLGMGLPPDVQHHLPLNMKSVGVEHGMDVEAMLAQMHHYATRETFDLDLNNCSNFAGSVLAAGASTPYLKSIFEERALGVIATPQSVSNSCDKFKQRYQSSPEDNAFKRFYRKSPFEKRASQQIRIILDESATRKEKLSTLPKLLAYGTAATISSVVRSLCTPKDAFMDCVHLIKFAANHQSTGLKVAGAVVGVLGAIVTAPFAAVEAVVTAPYKLAKAINNKIKSSKIRKQDFHADMVEAKEDDIKRKRALLKEKFGNSELEIGDKLIVIHDKNPISAMKKFEAELIAGNIPSFSAKTTQRILKFIDKLDDDLKDKLYQRYAQMISYSVNNVKAIQSGEQPKEYSDQDFISLQVETLGKVAGVKQKGREVLEHVRKRPREEHPVESHHEQSIIVWLKEPARYQLAIEQEVKDMAFRGDDVELARLRDFVEDTSNFNHKRQKLVRFSQNDQSKQEAAAEVVYQAIFKVACAEIEAIMKPLYRDVKEDVLSEDGALKADEKTHVAIQQRKSQAYEIYKQYKSYIPSEYGQDFTKLNDYINQSIDLHGVIAANNQRVQVTVSEDSAQPKAHIKAR